MKRWPGGSLKDYTVASREKALIGLVNLLKKKKDLLPMCISSFVELLSKMQGKRFILCRKTSFLSSAK